jgi:hypothetical protein
MKYTAQKTASAGRDSSYSIKDSNGKGSGLGFDSYAEAKRHIDHRLELGLDPMSDNYDVDAHAQWLLTH